ncbi:MAG: hypothetical protein NC231_10920 [Bacillus sp. (in: Bacteria)]|nr:hypothetical protein [Bacillus sp. (in: firmicutes)]MCM1427339.1 hypothetical protein [Eubacterium sp.]
MSKVNVYIYTTIKSPRKRQGAYTYLLESETSKGTATRSATEFLENVTAHQAELMALTAALKRICKHCDLTIYTDSVYVPSCVGKWLDKWQQDNWINAKGQPVANMEEWQDLACLLNEHSYHFVLGENHSYHEWLKAESERAEKNVCGRNRH